jgi:alanine racemase
MFMSDTPERPVAVSSEESKHHLSSPSSEVLASARATIHLDAIGRNYRKIVSSVGSSDTAVAVKADGYGLGAAAVAETLARCGCNEFFVAQIDEAIELRAVIPHATINVLSGLMPGTEREMVEYKLTPTIVSLQQLRLWQRQAIAHGRQLPTGLHIDSGMHRTGLPVKESAQLAREHSRLTGLLVSHVISHLASADDCHSPQSEQQLTCFLAATNQLPRARRSIANSAGIFRGKQFHLDLVRPGIAIYGGNPQPAKPNPMESTVVLEAPIVQVVDAANGDLIGYSATYKTPRDGRHAIVAAGYADGVLRSTSNTGQVAIDGRRCPIIGRVSMDLTIIDVTGIPQHLLYPGAAVELIGPTITVDDAARAADTISYEMLTSIGKRYRRRYTGKQTGH